MENLNDTLFLMLNAGATPAPWALAVATCLAQYLIVLVPIGLGAMWLHADASRRRALVTAAVAGAVGLAMGAAGTRAVAGDVQDKAAIERIVHDYILAHPEILPEAMMKLQERRSASAIAEQRSAIESSAPMASAPKYITPR